MDQVRLYIDAHQDGIDFLVLEDGVRVSSDDENWLTHSRVSVIKKDEHYLILNDVPWKNYVRMGNMSEDFRKADIQVLDGSILARTEAYRKAKEIGEKLARERKGVLIDDASPDPVVYDFTSAD